MDKTVADLKIGDTAVFEASYGPEQVTGIDEMFVGGVVIRGVDGKILIPPFIPPTSYPEPWIMLKLQLGGTKWGPRYVLRFKTEPVSGAEG